MLCSWRHDGVSRNVYLVHSVMCRWLVDGCSYFSGTLPGNVDFFNTVNSYWYVLGSHESSQILTSSRNALDSEEKRKRVQRAPAFYFAGLGLDGNS